MHLYLTDSLFNLICFSVLLQIDLIRSFKNYFTNRLKWYKYMGEMDGSSPITHQQLAVCQTLQCFMLVDRRDIIQLVIVHSHSKSLTRRCFYFQSSNKELGFIFFILRVFIWQVALLISAFLTMTYVLLCSLIQKKLHLDIEEFFFPNHYS